MLEIIVFASLLGCIPGAIAQCKGRSFVIWWIFGTLLLVIALPASLIVRRKSSSPLNLSPAPSDDSDLIGNRFLAWIAR